MPSDRRELILSNQAQEDLQAVAMTGLINWGRDQSVRYYDSVLAVLSSLTRFPGLGRQRTGTDQELRHIPVREHVVYYRFDDQAVFVIRILNRRMNPDQHLPGS